MSTPKKKTPSKSTTAFHLKDGEINVVGIGNLRVVIVKDDDCWFAQGLEIDHAEQGFSVEDAKSNFENGLRETIEQHLRINGTINKLLRVAPPEVWTEMLQHPAADKKFYSQVSVHDLKQLPYEGIQYLIAREAA